MSKNKEWSSEDALMRLISMIIALMSVIMLFKEFQSKLISLKIAFKFLPEDLQGELTALKSRWIKQKLSSDEIRCLTYKYLFHMIVGLIRVKIENLGLSNENVQKEKE
jgi:hypothetical protein